MGPNVYMYMHSISSGGESMNNANHAVRHAMAVDCINATILLLKLKSDRFAKQQTVAWNHDGYFLLFGQQMFDEMLEQTLRNVGLVLRKMNIFTLGR